MNKHTPGPWVFTTERGDNVIRGGGKTLMNDTQYYPYCPDEDADWRLIAAAPDLLDALQSVVSAWETGKPYVNEMGAARAAIARATGETA
jgi:hypothetical protein